ncbi:putative mitochondrial protein [Tanacetum coccineum]
MISAPVLSLPNFDQPFIVETDASGVGLGAVLQQNGHPIAYLSKTLSAKHQALSTYEKEFLCNQRNSLLCPCSSITTDLVAKIAKTWEEDTALQDIIVKLKQDGRAKKHYQWVNENLIRKGKLVVGKDEAVRNEILNHFHEGAIGGHSGVKVTTQKLCSLFYWKGLRKQVKNFVRECLVCQRYKPDLAAYPGLLQPLPIPEKVWTSVSMDFIEKLPKSQSFPPLRVEAVDRSLKARELAIQVLKFHLKRALNRMKQHADKGRSERILEVGDWVLLKLQPHRQVTLRRDKQHKFSAKYYGPYKLKKVKGAITNLIPVTPLPQCDNQGQIEVQPMTILDRKMVKHKNAAVVYALIQWTNGTIEMQQGKDWIASQRTNPDFDISS